MKKKVFVSIIIVCVIFISTLAIGFYLQQTPNVTSEEDSLIIAREFVKNSPTFQFDGIEETLKHVETLTARCPYCWQFTFTFDSRHAGYGDRKGQMIAQVITPHEVRIMVEKGKIVSAVIDGVWDMMKQEMVVTKPILSQKWVLQLFVSNGQKVVPPSNIKITIQFDKDGRVLGSGGCNNFFGSYRIGEGNTIILGPIAHTERACLEGMEQETRYFEALGKVTTFEVTPEGLMLSSEDGQTSLNFVVHTQ